MFNLASIAFNEFNLMLSLKFPLSISEVKSFAPIIMLK